MGRWLVMYGQRERIDPDPVGDRADFDALVQELNQRASTPTAGWCTGLDDQAKRVWNSWYHSLYHRQVPSNIVGVKARAPTLARKAALLYGWDYGAARYADQWQISLAELEPAIALAACRVQPYLA